MNGDTRKLGGWPGEERKDINLKWSVYHIWELPRKKVPQIARTKLSTVSINSKDLIAEELKILSIKLVGSWVSVSWEWSFLASAEETFVFLV